MDPDRETSEEIPNWDDLLFTEKLDLVALPILLPALLWFMHYLVGSR